MSDSKVTITRTWTIDHEDMEGVQLDGDPEGGVLGLHQSDDHIVLEIGQAQALLELLPLAIEQAEGVSV